MRLLAIASISKMLLQLCLCSVVCWVSSAGGFPAANGYPRASPNGALMLEEYYGRHFNPRSGYVPRSAMTAFVSGDAMAAGTYFGDEYGPNYPKPNANNNNNNNNKRYARDQTEVSSTTETSIEEATFSEEPEVPEVVKKNPTARRRPQRPAIGDEKEEDEDEDEESGWPFKNTNGRAFYNTFFPIMIGFPGSKARSSNQEGGYPGVTAIANSFSTGKGGVASSHATSFGDPALASLLKNGRFNFRKTHQDDDKGQ